MLVRDESLNVMMSYYLIERLKQTPNIVVQTSVEVAECRGARRLESLVLQHTKTKDRRTVAAQSLFILIGALPHTDWLGDTVLRDEHGFILSGPDLVRDGYRSPAWSLTRDPYLFETSVPGIFVAGDARSREAVKTLQALQRQFGHNLRFVFRHFPLQTNILMPSNSLKPLKPRLPRASFGRCMSRCCKLIET